MPGQTAGDAFGLEVTGVKSRVRLTVAKANTSGGERGGPHSGVVPLRGDFPR